MWNEGATILATGINSLNSPMVRWQNTKHSPMRNWPCSSSGIIGNRVATSIIQTNGRHDLQCLLRDKPSGLLAWPRRAVVQRVVSLDPNWSFRCVCNLTALDFDSLSRWYQWLLTNHRKLSDKSTERWVSYDPDSHAVLAGLATVSRTRIYVPRRSSASESCWAVSVYGQTMAGPLLPSQNVWVANLFTAQLFLWWANGSEVSDYVVGSFCSAFRLDNATEINVHGKDGFYFGHKTFLWE